MRAEPSGDAPVAREMEYKGFTLRAWVGAGFPTERHFEHRADEGVEASH